MFYNLCFQVAINVVLRLADTQNQMSTTPSLFPDLTREIYFDIETLRLSHEVEGGWSNIARFGLAVAVTWDAQNHFRRWFEPDAKALIVELGQFDRIVSFNGDRFDFEVLSAYQPVKHLLGKSFDLLVDLHRRLGHRIKLDDLAKETLGNKKTGDGLEVVQWWREADKPAKPMASSDWSTKDVGSASRILVKLAGEGRMIDIQIPQMPDLRRGIY